MRSIAAMLLLFGCADFASGTPALADVPETGLAAPRGEQEIALQAREAEAIQNAYRAIESAGIRTPEDWQRAAATIARTLAEEPLSRPAMEARVAAELDGHAYTPPTALTAAAIIEQQTAASESWAASLRAELPALSDEQLTSARIKLTVGLAVLITQAANSPGTGGIDTEVLAVIQAANQSMRADVIAEMRTRGLTR